MPAVCALLGCAVVDQYSGRAIVYNLEAEQAQDQALLLNIVRAYLRRPMQFTTVSSITGTAIASAGTQYSLPADVPFRPSTQGATGIAAFPPLPTWQFSGSMSGGPAFTVPVLDTQEFYEGILKAIPAQLWDLYLQANYPPDLLFNLFVQKAIMRRTDDKSCEADHTAKCEFVFENYPGSDIQIDLFQALGDYLLWLGMTTEAQKPPSVPLYAFNSVNVRYVGTPGSPLKKGHYDIPTAEVVAPPGGSAAPDAQPSARVYKLCFAPRVRTDLVKNSLCGSEKPSRGRITGDTSPEITTAGSATVGMALDPEFVCHLIGIARERADQDREYLGPKDEADAAKTAVQQFEAGKAICREKTASGEKIQVSLTIYMRNTEGMIYYLGELARRSLSTNYGNPSRDFFARQLSGYIIYPHFSDMVGALDRCKELSDCAYIFHLHEGATPAPGDFISALYNGQWYWVSSDYNAAQPDRSTLTLEFVKQLVAVNSSAKSLPQSSVITTVGGQ
jgi:hypothetical protein